MVSASVGKERSQIRSGNARPVWKTVHRQVKNEDGEDQVNGIDTTETCLLLLRTYLASYPDCAKSDSKANQDQATISGNAWPLSIQIQHCCKTRMQNEVIDRGWGGIRLVVEATRFVNDIRSLSSALDQVTDYIVLYNVSRETNNHKHNAWFPLLQKTRQQIREESYRGLCL